MPFTIKKITPHLSACEDYQFIWDWQIYLKKVTNVIGFPGLYVPPMNLATGVAARSGAWKRYFRWLFGTIKKILGAFFGTGKKYTFFFVIDPPSEKRLFITYLCASKGVHNLLELVEKSSSKFTFFYNMGRGIHYKSFFNKKRKGDALPTANKLSNLYKLGKFGYLRTAILNPKVGGSHPDIIKLCQNRL